jgi:hypothetical protein
MIRPSDSSRQYGKSAKVYGKYFLFPAATVTLCEEENQSKGHKRTVQNFTPATENMVVHVTIIEENRTQETVLNYCAQAKAMLKYVQKCGRGTAFILTLCIHLHLDLQIYQQRLQCHAYFQSEHGKETFYFPHILKQI